MNLQALELTFRALLNVELCRKSCGDFGGLNRLLLEGAMVQGVSFRCN